MSYLNKLRWGDFNPIEIIVIIVLILITLGIRVLFLQESDHAGVSFLLFFPLIIIALYYYWIKNAKKTYR